MTKKQKQSESSQHGQEELDAARSDLHDQLAALIAKFKARVNVVDWASICLENAEQYVGVSGDELLSRTKEISDAAKIGTVVKYDMHLSLYMNMVRDALIASGKVQRRAIPTIINITKMATSYLVKEPISIEMVQGFIQPIVAHVITTLENSVASYLARAVPIESTRDAFFEVDLTTQLGDAIIRQYQELIKENWAIIYPKAEGE